MNDRTRSGGLADGIPPLRAEDTALLEEIEPEPLDEAFLLGVAACVKARASEWRHATTPPPAARRQPVMPADSDRRFGRRKDRRGQPLPGCGRGRHIGSNGKANKRRPASGG